MAWTTFHEAIHGTFITGNPLLRMAITATLEARSASGLNGPNRADIPPIVELAIYSNLRMPGLRQLRVTGIYGKSVVSATEAIDVDRDPI